MKTTQDYPPLKVTFDGYEGSMEVTVDETSSKKDLIELVNHLIREVNAERSFRWEISQQMSKFNYRNNQRGGDTQ